VVHGVDAVVAVREVTEAGPVGHAFGNTRAKGASTSGVVAAVWCVECGSAGNAGARRRAALNRPKCRGRCPLDSVH
jgi:hypothetical protein